VSKNDNCHCTGTTKVAVKVVGNECLKMTFLRRPQKRHRGCGHDMLGQAIPSTDSSNGEGLIADGAQPCMTGLD